MPIFRTEQKPREYIITFPKAYHAGFSHGYNVSEAVNIATPEWIPFAENAVQVYSKEGFLRKTTFPFEWIIVENAIYRDDMDLTNEAKEHVSEVGNRIGGVLWIFQLIYFVKNLFFCKILQNLCQNII